MGIELRFWTRICDCLNVDQEGRVYEQRLVAVISVNHSILTLKQLLGILLFQVGKLVVYKSEYTQKRLFFKCAQPLRLI